jgi:hypothetical protein
VNLRMTFSFFVALCNCFASVQEKLRVFVVATLDGMEVSSQIAESSHGLVEWNEKLILHVKTRPRTFSIAFYHRSPLKVFGGDEKLGDLELGKHELTQERHFLVIDFWIGNISRNWGCSTWRRLERHQVRYQWHPIHCFTVASICGYKSWWCVLVTCRGCVRLPSSNLNFHFFFFGTASFYKRKCGKEIT